MVEAPQQRGVDSDSMADEDGFKDELQQRQLRVFLSYARIDRPRVAMLADALGAAGFDVWWDALIEGGAAFAKTIAAALDAADVVVVVWSKTSVESDWVLDEAMHARDRRKLVPVTIDGSQSPLGFRQYQAIDLVSWSGDRGADSWTAATRAISAIAGGARREAASAALPPTGPAPAAPRPPSATTIAPNPARRGLLAAITGAAAAAAIGGGFYQWRRRTVEAAPPNSIAVLPFRNLSEDPSQNYFSDGLAEEMRIALSRDSLLRVAAQTSSNVFRDHKEGARSIAAQLQVAFLLDGSVRRAGDVVRIGVSLIDAATGFNRWSQTFDRTMKDIFAIQVEIAETVVRSLSAQIATLRPNLGGTTSVPAYDAYLRGLELFHRDAGEQSDRQALASFDAAIAADPNYAFAYAAKSRALANFAGQYAQPAELSGYYKDAETAARRAIAIAPDLADAQLALGEVLFSCRLAVGAARESYDQAYRLGGGIAYVLSAYAFYCAMTGRAADALAAAKKSANLDPLNARTLRMTGWVHYAARNYDDAIAALQVALHMNPKLVHAHSCIGDALLLTGRLKDARDAYAAEPGPAFRLTGLAIAERRLGNPTAARVANDALVSELGDAWLYQQAQVMAQWDQPDAAIGLLQRAQAVGDGGLLYSHTDPLIDGLRSDPRFRRLQKDLGFE